MSLNDAVFILWRILFLKATPSILASCAVRGSGVGRISVAGGVRIIV